VQWHINAKHGDADGQRVPTRRELEQVAVQRIVEEQVKTVVGNVPSEHKRVEAWGECMERNLAAQAEGIARPPESAKEWRRYRALVEEQSNARRAQNARRRSEDVRAEQAKEALRSTLAKLITSLVPHTDGLLDAYVQELTRALGKRVAGALVEPVTGAPMNLEAVQIERTIERDWPFQTHALREALSFSSRGRANEARIEPGPTEDAEVRTVRSVEAIFRDKGKQPDGPPRPTRIERVRENARRAAEWIKNRARRVR
jgi:hypothetical protein